MKDSKVLGITRKNNWNFIFFALTLCALFAISPKSRLLAQKLLSRDDGPIKVGLYLDLTGQTKSFGESTRNGIMLAADEINEAGGINGRKILLIVKDNEGEPGKSATVVEKLIKEGKVHALLGEVASSNSLASAPLAQEAQVPMISPSSTHPRVTQIGDYIFRACFIDPLQGEAMAKFAINSLKAKRAAIFFDVNSDYGRGIVKTFKQKFAALGGTVTTEQGYSQGNRDFRAQLATVQATKPDVIYVAGYYQEAATIAVQARQMDINQPLLGGDGWDSPQLWEIGGKALNNSYISSHYAVDDPSPINQNFIARYQNKYPDAVPNAFAALGYDAMMVLADAIRRAGTTDGPKLRDAIAQAVDYPGVTGPITINAARNAVKQVVILKASNGKFVFRENIPPDPVN